MQVNKKTIMAAALALMLAGPMAQSVRAEVTVDFSGSEGFGIAEHVVQINDILVTNIIENPFDPAHPELVEVSYNVPFRFDMASLHLIPDLDAAGTSDDPDAACATLTVNVSDAGTGYPVDQAVVTVGNDTLYTDTAGTVTFSGLPGGQPVMIDVAARDYESSQRNMELECGEQSVGVALNPEGWQEEPGYTGDSVRIVLTWGENPRDLDSHLTGPTAESYMDDSRFHVYYASRTADVANLDVDDTDSYGPETVTITPPEGSTTLRPGLYRYSVYHFSGTGTLATSSAQVELYIGDTVRTFTPPADGSETLTGSGDLWTVFELNVNDDGVMTVYPVNTYSTASSSTVETPTTTTTGMGAVETGIDFARLPGK